MSEFLLSKYRDPSGYYTLMHDHVTVGFVKWDPLERLWRAWCFWARCNELGQAHGKNSAASDVREHWLREHR